eukprot:scaffold210428_cov50-Attheya_sp.AAC.1
MALFFLSRRWRSSCRVDGVLAVIVVYPCHDDGVLAVEFFLLVTMMAFKYCCHESCFMGACLFVLILLSCAAASKVFLCY